MKIRGLACFVGLLGAVTACSGTYTVGLGNGGAGGAPSSSAGASPAGASSAGASSAGASFGGASMGGTTSFGGSDATPGAGGEDDSAGQGPVLPNYCGYQLPTEQLSEFAPPALVAERIQRLILGTSVPEGNLPAVVTREWASSYALAVLDSVSSDSTPGMRSFIERWWPGTDASELWASYFSSRHGKLRDLLQSTVQLPQGAGVLTDPVVLEKPTISRRGAFLNEHLLCRSVPPSPPNVPVSPVPPNVTRRQDLEQQIAPPVCKSCHNLMDPPGLALEHFAQDGTFLTTDAGQPIDSSSTLRIDNDTLAFANVNELGLQASTNCVVIICFARTLLESARQNASLSGGDLTEREIGGVAKAIAEADGDLRQSLSVVVQSDRFLQP